MQSPWSQSHSPDPPHWGDAPEIISLSASDKSGIKKGLIRLKEQLSGSHSSKLLHVVAAETRSSFTVSDPYRIVFTIEFGEDPMRMCESVIEYIDLHHEMNWTEKSIYYGENKKLGSLAFVFPGQGSQYVNMGKDITECFSEAFLTLRKADKFFGRKKSLRSYIYPGPAKDESEKTAFEERLRSTDIAQPAIGSVSLIMLKVLLRFGILPDAACGHSYGELSALYSSGRISEKAFFFLSAERGKYMAQAGQGKDSGSMLAVKAPLDKIQELLNTARLPIILANRNSPDQGVLSGPTEEILQMKSVLKEHKIKSTLLPVAAAFHSALVKEAALPFQQVLEKIDFMQSSTPVYSNTTGSPYPVSSEAARKLLGIHLMNPVHFINNIENMYKDGIHIFVEVGPKAVLTALVKTILEGKDFTAIAVDASSGRRSGMTDLAKVLCHLASNGYPVNLSKWRQPVKKRTGCGKKQTIRMHPGGH